VAAATNAGGEFSIDETEAILFALAQAVEQRDRQTAGHCERLAFMGVALGMAMRLDRISLLALYRGGYLHDVGKVGIPDSILFKPDQLTAEEWVTMRSHTIRGEEICRHLKSLGPALPIIRHHHERWDGAGYPAGLEGEAIPLEASIVGLADAWDAMTATRPYKEMRSVEEALGEVKRCSGTHFRSEVVDSMIAALTREPQIFASLQQEPDETRKRRTIVIRPTRVPSLVESLSLSEA
jgi:putative two-component system response regulator